MLHDERTRLAGQHLAATHACQGVIGLTVVDGLRRHSASSASLNRMAIESRLAYRGKFTRHSVDRRGADWYALTAWS